MKKSSVHIIRGGDKMNVTKPVKVITVYSRVQAEMILDLLKQHDIPAYRLGSGANDIMYVKFGDVGMVEDIMVDVRCLEDAKEILADFLEDEDKLIITQSRKKQRIAVFAFIGVYLLANLLIIFLRIL